MPNRKSKTERKSTHFTIPLTVAQHRLFRAVAAAQPIPVAPATWARGILLRAAQEHNRG